MGLFSRRSKEPAAEPQPHEPALPQPSTSSAPEMKTDLPPPSFGPPTLNIPGLGMDAGGGLNIPSMSPQGGGKLYDPYEGRGSAQREGMQLFLCAVRCAMPQHVHVRTCSAAHQLMTVITTTHAGHRYRSCACCSMLLGTCVTGRSTNTTLRPQAQVLYNSLQHSTSNSSAKPRLFVFAQLLLILLLCCAHLACLQ